MQRNRFVPSRTVLEKFTRAAPIDPQRFRAEVDRVIDQDPAPRA